MKMNGFIPPKKVIHRMTFNFYNSRIIGVLEYWSAGVLAETLIASCNTPVLQHSNTP